ncbi:MAG: cell division protein SepF [Lachnospiraceae bacterium]|nr:cell division protein SepF [Lachnospiraceae bacterium]
MQSTGAADCSVIEQAGVLARSIPMSVVDNLVKFITIGNENDDQDFDDYDDIPDEVDDHGPAESPVSNIRAVPDPEPETAPRTVKRASRPVPMRQKRNVNIGGGMEVCVIKPTRVDETRDITDTLLQNRTVVLNLEDIDEMSAQRILDFTSGSCYAMDGNLQKISQRIFIVTPASVEISGDFLEVFGQNQQDDTY